MRHALAGTFLTHARVLTGDQHRVRLRLQAHAWMDFQTEQSAFRPQESAVQNMSTDADF